MNLWYRLTLSGRDGGILPMDDQYPNMAPASGYQASLVLGEHIVFLEYVVSAEEQTRKIKPKASRELRAVIARYGDLKKSPLRYEVTGDGQFIEIELT